MPLPASKRKKIKFFEYMEVNLISVINVFLIIIPFLVVSVVLSRMVSYNLKLPEKNNKKNLTNQKVKQSICKIFLKNDYIVLKLDDKKNDTLINNDSLGINFANLLKRVDYIKQCYLIPDDSVTYADIISIMDILNENNITNIALKY